MARQFRVIPVASAKLDPNAAVADVIFVDAKGKPTDIGSAAVKPATHVALAAGATPTKSEFDALVNSLIAAGLMAAE